MIVTDKNVVINRFTALANDITHHTMTVTASCYTAETTRISQSLIMVRANFTAPNHLP